MNLFDFNRAVNEELNAARAMIKSEHGAKITFDWVLVGANVAEGTDSYRVYFSAKGEKGGGSVYTRTMEGILLEEGQDAVAFAKEHARAIVRQWLNAYEAEKVRARKLLEPHTKA